MRIPFLFLLTLAPVVGMWEPVDASEPRGDELDIDVYWIIKAKCAKCHDDLGSSAADEISDLLDLSKLSTGHFNSANEDALEQLIFGNEPRMPKPEEGSLTWNGPLSESEKAQLRKWINRGGPSDVYIAAIERPARPLISLKAANQFIAEDLGKLRGPVLQNARYLTLVNLHNDATVSASSLELFRAAIVKTLNSLSSTADVLGLDTSTAVNRLVAVDATRTIFRFDLRHIGWTQAKWDLVASFYPYAIEPAAGISVAAMTSSRQPEIRGDWFVFAALQPPLYHDLAEIPATLDELETMLGVDRQQSIRAGQVARAGFVSSRVSVNNRLIERIPMRSRSGAYHISYDFASNNDQQNLLDFPFGPVGTLADRHAFKHDGGEIIFNLPNGYQAYMLVDAQGRRLDIAPQSIVQDRTMPGSVIINGISCLSCHVQGMKPEQFSPVLQRLDQVRDAVTDNRARFTVSDQQLAEELYPPHDRFRELIEQDRRRFLSALRDSGIPQRGSVEPARALFDQFKDNLPLTRLAAEFGLTPEEMRQRMQKEGETRRLLSRAEQNELKRQLQIAEFSRTAQLIGVGQVALPKPLPFPYFGEKTDKRALNESVEAAAPPGFGSTGVDLIDAENLDGKMKVEMWMEDQRLSYKEGDLMRCRIRANEDCFLTLISVDAKGAMTLLVPNPWHPELPLRGGSTVTIPTQDMLFDIIAQPPHGQTLIKAIVTKQPLKLKPALGAAMKQAALVELGTAKAFRIQQKPAGDRLENNETRLTDLPIQQQFKPDDWATASWSLVTRKQ